MVTKDQQFTLPSEGQSDWDASLNANLAIAERGYHTTARAGVAVRTADVCWMTSGGFFVPFDPSSDNISPQAIAPVSAASGESIQWLLSGIVRSVGLTMVPGRDYFVSPATPGVIVGSYSAATRRIGFGVDDGGFYFNPRPMARESLVKVETITINPTSTHFFSLDVGRTGWVRDLHMKSNSADKVGLAFYSNSARDNLLYMTISGGLTTVTSFTDRAGWPFENTDASTLSGLIYGKIWPDSGAVVASQAVQVRIVADRWL